MECPNCGSTSIRVTDTLSDDKDNVFRRRKCSDCSHSFRTVEMIISDNPKLNYRYSAAYDMRHGKDKKGETND